MASASKPWEGVPRASSTSQLTSARNDSTAVASSTNFIGVVDRGQRPPVPPRPTYDVASTYTGYGNYGTSSSLPYGSPYGPYSGYGFPSRSSLGVAPYGGFGFNQGNGIFRQVQESTRDAFLPIENVLTAFSSISMMLESSYSALINSFNAVLGVADQFSRLRVHLSQVLSSLAIFRLLKWLYKRVLLVLRLREAVPNEESWMHVWKGAAASVENGPSTPLSPAHGPHWPLAVFAALIIGGPWLLWKLMHKMVKTKDSWLDGDECVVGAALYTFQADGSEELSFTEGQQLMLAPPEFQPRLQRNDWLIASVDGVKTGWVPANYVRVLGRKSKKSS